MIVYSKSKREFINDVLSNQIEKSIQTSVVRELGHSTGKSEIQSWRNSMLYMNNIINDPEIPEDAGIAIEYKIPQTSKRIDFIITGLNTEYQSIAVLVELKQWSHGISISDKDGIVNTTFFGETNHPSYQVWSYATLIEDYNSNVQDDNIQLKPCAYLHNYETDDDILRNEFYKEYLSKAPVFLRQDALKLNKFIKEFVKYGDSKNILYTIEHGKIRPSKALADSLASMLQGNKEFTLIDDQKIVYETALKLAKESTSEKKNVLIVEGGPGTGKSVVAINLLTELTNRGDVTQYVTKNSAPREVYQVKLTGKFTKTRISNLFTSSGGFYDVESNTFDSLVVDEAHRLNEKSGLFSHLGNNQIQELINAAKLSIFFIDEDQRVTLKDIGKKGEIEKWAKEMNVSIHKLTLASQFRCNGSDGYLAWLDNILQIKGTANESLKGINYNFQVMDDPKLLHKKITEENTLNNKSRLVAGYCWDWISKKHLEKQDIVIGDYKAFWNLNKHGQSWIVQPDSVTEIGCIHTCQGLELDYVGVIIGSDLLVRDGVVLTDYKARAKTDQSLKGIKKMAKEYGEEYAQTIAEPIIKNTYRTLMTRGMKGCYIYSEDEETREYFKSMIRSSNSSYSNIPDGISLNIDSSKKW